MRHLSALIAILAFAAVGVGSDTDLVFPTGGKEVRLRLEVTGEDTSPDAAWGVFLDKLFAHFDRDGNGTLSEAEAKRVFPLPLPDGKTISPDFAVMDTDRDGKVTLAEFRAYYRARGFTPVALIVLPTSAESLALSEALFRHLDRDNDGKLTAAELRNALTLLKRLDEDEDEVLTAAELLGAVRSFIPTKPAGLKLAPATKVSAAVLRLSLTGKLAVEGKSFRLDGSRLHVPGGVCSVAVVKDDPASGLKEAKSFYRAQFKAAAGTKPATKALFEDDSTAQVLAGLFDAADRDGDGKLTLAELDAFFDLVELGVACRVVVTATDRGRNLFDLFDTDGDGRLDLAELLRAGRTLPDELTRDKPLERSAVPASYRLVASRGPVGDSFGPVPFGSATKSKTPAPKAARGPAWFRAMDKNADGFVSAQEFVGPPALFAKLDINGDGRISVEEAEAATPP